MGKKAQQSDQFNYDNLKILANLINLEYIQIQAPQQISIYYTIFSYQMEDQTRFTGKMLKKHNKQKNKSKFFSNHSQSLLEALQATNLQFQTLYDLFADRNQSKIQLEKDQKLLKFAKQLIILKDQQQQVYVNERDEAFSFDRYEDLFKHVLTQQLMDGKNYVHCKHIDLKYDQIRLENLNFSFALLTNQCPFDKIWAITSSLFMKKLLKNYLLFYKYQGQYIQIAGKPLNQITCQCGFMEKKRKNNKQSENNVYNVDVLVLDRLKMFYNRHIGRNAGIFRHNSFFKSGITKSNENNQVRDLAQVLIAQLSKFQAKFNKTSKKVEQTLEAKQSNMEMKSKLQTLMMSFMINFRNLVEIRRHKNKSSSHFDALIAHCCPLQNQKYHKAKKQVQAVLKEHYEGKTQLVFDSLYQLDTPYKSVAKLLRKMLDEIVPKDLFGSQNFQNFLDFFPSFVEMKRFEVLKVDQILAKIDIFGVPWLDINFNKRHKKIILSRAKFIMGWVIKVIFNQCIVPVIKYNFYVTEKHKQGNKIFYYRKPIWVLISKMAVKQFSTNNLQQIKYKQLKNINNTKYGNFPKGKLRILPKKGTFRPIITFNRKIRMESENLPYPMSKSLNQWLAQTQLVLRNLKNTLAQRVGYSIFDNRQIGQKYDQFVKKWRENGSPKLAYFTLDIQKCYDSINTQKLKEIIEQTKLIQKQYLIVQYYRMYRNKKALMPQKKKTYGFPYYFNFRERTNAIPFDENIMKINEQNIPSINIFTGKKALLTRKQIIKNLSILCKGSIVQYQDNFWLQKVGIPQGLNVSGVVCSLYFGTLQKNRIKVNQGLLMRLTDDYLYIGPEQEAIKVLQALFEMSRVYEFNFNADKITANFDHKLIKQKSNDPIITWIGKRINVQTLEMFPVVETSLIKLYFAMNVNLSRKTLYVYLKNKLKSLFTNHFASYFKPYLYSVSNLKTVLRMVTKITLGKFFPFVKEVYKFKRWLVHNKKNDNLFILRILHDIINQFIIYACYLCKVKNPDNLNKLYDIFYYVVIDQASIFFKTVRKQQKLNTVYICLQNQSKNLKQYLCIKHQFKQQQL